MSCRSLTAGGAGRPVGSRPEDGGGGGGSGGIPRWKICPRVLLAAVLVGAGCGGCDAPPAFSVVIGLSVGNAFHVVVRVVGNGRPAHTAPSAATPRPRSTAAAVGPADGGIVISTGDRYPHGLPAAAREGGCRRVAVAAATPTCAIAVLVRISVKVAISVGIGMRVRVDGGRRRSTVPLSGPPLQGVRRMFAIGAAARRGRPWWTSVILRERVVGAAAATTLPPPPRCRRRHRRRAHHPRRRRLRTRRSLRSRRSGWWGE